MYVKPVNNILSPTCLAPSEAKWGNFTFEVSDTKKFQTNLFSRILLKYCVLGYFFDAEFSGEVRILPMF